MITILGKSAGTLSMIADNFESYSKFEMICVINNLGIVDDFPYKNSYKWTEDDSLKEHYNNFLLGTTYPITKKKIFDTFKQPVNDFINCIHKSAEISSTADLGKGIIINSLVSVAGHSKIGNFVTVNRNASIGHHCDIEEFVTIAPSAVICGKVRIGKGTFIGAGAIIRDGITIGENCTIGIGSVIVKDIADNIIGYGNPFQVSKQLNSSINS